MEEIDLSIINEFVVESMENLARLDREIVALEQRPDDAGLLASVFRTIHTIKGTCGFLGFHTLERITHHAETILSQVRNGERPLTPELVSLTLATVDAVRTELTSIESTAAESGAEYTELIERQEAAARGEGVEARAGAAAQAPERVAVATPECTIVPEAAVPPTTSAVNTTIRVDVGLLDRLMNLVGELVLARNQVLQFNAQRDDPAFNATSQRLSLITTELQVSVMKTRMQPIGMIWSKLPRVVRDLAQSCGKQIHLEMEGEETELDKTIIEAIKDPLTHIVRNSADHGIETPEARVRAGKTAQGRLTLRAFHEGGNVNIEIADDGAGIDPQKLKASALRDGRLRPEQAENMQDRELQNLVFLPGLSTAKEVSNISGRGVGMDVVKTNIEHIGGTVDLSSKVGQGTVVKIKIPLTLAIIPGLVVTCGAEQFVIPQVSLLELIRLEGDEIGRRIEDVHGTPVYRRRGKLLPVAFLNQLLGIEAFEGREATRALNIVVVRAEDRHFGLVVDGINDTQEIVVKPLGKQFKKVSCYAGATIMGDGKVALILDIPGMAQLLGLHNETRAVSHGSEPAVVAAGMAETRSLLLFCAGRFGRMAVPLSAVSRLEEFRQSSFERSANGLAMQYRGEILPVLMLADHLEGGVDRFGASVRGGGSEDKLFQVIVIAEEGRRVGLAVDRIVDIVEEPVAIERASSRAGFLGSAVVAHQITDFLDLGALSRSMEERWSSRERAHEEESEVPEALAQLALAVSPTRGAARECFAAQ